MFEKEAEEYKDNTRIKDKNTYIGFPDERISEVQDFEGNYIDISERIIKAFKDGAEFGYNKANEWHYVKDGDLPLMMEDEREISNNVWIHIKNWGTEVGHYDYRKKAWIVRCMIVNLDVIAWCEIPKYTEE